MNAYQSTAIQTPTTLEVIPYNGVSLFQDSTAINLARKFPPSNITGPEVLHEFWFDSVAWPILGISQELKKHVGAYFDTYRKLVEHFYNAFPSRMGLLMKEVRNPSDLEVIAKSCRLRMIRDEKNLPVFFAPTKNIEISTE